MFRIISGIFRDKISKSNMKKNRTTCLYESRNSRKENNCAVTTHKRKHDAPPRAIPNPRSRANRLTAEILTRHFTK